MGNCLRRSCGCCDTASAEPGQAMPTTTTSQVTDQPTVSRGSNGSAEAGKQSLTNPPSDGGEKSIEQPVASTGSSGSADAGHSQQPVSPKLPAEASIGEREHGKAKTSSTAPPTLEDVITHFKDLNNSASVDELISAIKQLLHMQTERQSKKEEAGTSSQNMTVEKRSDWVSFIKSGAKFFKFFNDHLEKSRKKGDGRAIAKEMLTVVGNTHWVVAGLSITAYLLGKFDKVSENRDGCLQLLESMVSLATHVKNLNNEIPQEREKLEKAFECIAEGCILCASQLSSKSFFRFLKSSVNSESLRKLREKVNSLYADLSLAVGIATKHEQPGYLPPSQPPKPDAVGIQQPLAEVIDLLDMTSKDESSVAVVVYGHGGIGKTTLANAVVASLDLKGTYNHTCLEMDALPERNDITKMQEQILMDAFPNYNNGKKIMLRHCQEGRYHLTEAFKSAGNKPVFFFIDNCLRATDLTELLPEDELKGLPRRSRILLTTRNLKETDMLERETGLQRRKYPVQILSKEEAHKILLKEAVDADFHCMELDLERIVRVCGGIPLVLKMVGARLRKHNYRVDKCTELLDALEKGKKIKEQDLSERLVDFVYRQLEEDTQEAFLDICWFFNNWKRRYVEYIVGTEHLQSLEEAALVSSTTLDVTGWEFDSPIMKVNVHDVVRAKGRSMAEGSRIMNVESFEEAKEDEASLKKIKGLWLLQHGTKSLNDSDSEDDWTFNSRSESENKEVSFECIVGEKQLNLMRKSLRVLALGDGVSVGGGSHLPFKELRYLQTEGDIPCIPVRLQAQHKLAVYYGPLVFKEEDVKLPQNIQMVKAKRQWKIVGDPKPIKAVSNCNLIELNLNEIADMMSTTGVLPLLDEELLSLNILIFDYCRQIKELPEEFCRLRSLTKFSMHHCESLEFLPEQFGRLSSLTYLILQECSKLKELPPTIGQLSSLQTLDLTDCSELKELPPTIGQLNALQTLDLRNCSELKKLPPTIGQLSSLQTLDLTDCSELKELPPTIGQLNSLQTLDLTNCGELKKLPPTIGQLSALQTLYLRNCNELKELPPTIGQLSSLQTLHLRNCSELKELPPTIGQLSSLQTLDLTDYSELKELPPTIGQLSSLQTLDLTNCGELKKLPPTIGQLSSLQTLDLTDCSELKELPTTIGQLSSLQTLYLRNCSELKKLPPTIGQLSSLTFLSLMNCSKLKELPPTIGQLNSLQTLYLTNCSELKGLPSNFIQLNSLERLYLFSCPKLQNSPSTVLQLKTFKVSNSVNIEGIELLD